MQKIVGVKKYKEKCLSFFLENIDDLKVGDKLVVDFDDFQTVVEVARLGLTVDDDKAAEMKKILRRATEADITKFETLKAKAKMFLPEIKKKSLALGLIMKFVSAEYSLDGSKILIVFSSEERVDFRQLLKELAVMLKARIELRQIGQRDEIKVCGAVGQCGQPCCCARFLNDFEHVTVKMAKIQGLSLSPTKINGICGRLMCCLAYESEMYEELISKMPKISSEINTPHGRGVVVYNDILRERVSVRLHSDGDTYTVEDFSLEEINQAKNINFEEEKVQKEMEFAENFIKNGQSSTENVENDSEEEQSMAAESNGKIEKPASNKSQNKKLNQNQKNNKPDFDRNKHSQGKKNNKFNNKNNNGGGTNVNKK